MQQKSVIGDTRLPGISAMLGPFLVASVFTAAMVGIGGALLYGPAIRATLERHWAEEIESENGEICPSLGMTSPTGQTTCAEALARVRRLHEDRLSRDSIL